MRTLTFFQFIHFYFGGTTVLRLKRWIRLKKCLTKLLLRIDFLRKCITYNITPTHLNNCTRYSNILYGNASRLKCDKIMNRFIKDMLKNEIRDTYVHIRSLRYEIIDLARLISIDLPVSVSNSFFMKQNTSQRLFHDFIKRKFDKKLDWLLRKQRTTTLSNIRPIRYYCKYSAVTVDSNSDKTLSDHVDTEFSANPIEPTPSSSSFTIYIDPASFNPFDSFAGQLKEKWFINLSSHNIPHEVQSILQLGERFCLPIINKERTTINLLKYVEHNINKLPTQIRQTIRNRTFPLINKFHDSFLQTSPVDRQFLQAYSITKKFITDNPNILFTRADKGNVTVAMSRDDYMSKMSTLLADRTTYVPVSKNPTRKLIGSLHELVMRWKTRGYISNSTYKNLNYTDGVLPRAYGLPKIHKQNFPLRVIISSRGTPLYGLAKFLHDAIITSIPRPNSYVANSFQLVEKLKGLHIKNDYKLISLDVISLFTNIPLEMAIDSIMGRWDYIGRKCAIPQDEFIIAIKFIMNSTYFMFDEHCYRQTFGTPMGSPLSPIIADITLQDLENRAVAALPIAPPFYLRYVDDIVLAAPSSTFDTIINTFNSYHPRLQFTVEEEVDGRLNFLDVTIIVSNGSLQFNWFQKPTYSGRYLNFESRHPLCHKSGIIISLTDKVLRLSHPRFHQQNLESIIKILIDNGYPLALIFYTINKRLKKILFSDNSGRSDSVTIDSFMVNNLKTDSVNNDNTTTNKLTYFNIPYIKDFSEKFRACAKDLNVRMSYTGINNLSRFITTGKDKLHKGTKSNIVYKINCNNCDASYVGQTGRLLNTRLKEHRRNHTSVIANHKLLNHDFNWDDVEILDEEPFLGRRLISEMIHIKRLKNALNLQSDTFSLNEACLPIIDSLSKI